MNDLTGKQYLLLFSANIRATVTRAATGKCISTMDVSEAYQKELT